MYIFVKILKKPATATEGFFNKGFAKVAVQCSADTPDSYRDVVNQSLVLRINPDRYRDGENHQLLVAAKR